MKLKELQAPSLISFNVDFTVQCEAEGLQCAESPVNSPCMTSRAPGKQNQFKNKEQ